MAWAVEYTDTYGGEANYSWVRRATLGARKDESLRSLMRRIKKEMGLTGVRGRTYNHGDQIEFRPYGVCTVLFATWSDWRERRDTAERVSLAASASLRGCG